MSPVNALKHDARWLFCEEERAELLAQIRLGVWSKKEDNILERYFPNYAELTHQLPGRTIAACRRRACRLKLTKSQLKWSDEEIAILRRNYKTASWGTLLETLPRRSVTAIRVKAHNLRIYRHTREKYVFGIYVIDEVLSRAEKLNFSMSDLDKEAGTYAYFRQMRGRRWPIYVRMDAIDAAVKAMGGRIVIQWSDE